MANIILTDEYGLLCDLIQFKLSAAGHRIQIVIYGQKAFEDKQRRRTPNAAEFARKAGPAIGENIGYRQINLVFWLLGMWRLFRNDNSCARVPRIGFRRSDESKTDWPLTVKRRLEHANSDIAEVKRPPAHAAVDRNCKRANHG